jgi:hypothetical protein
MDGVLGAGRPFVYTYCNRIAPFFRETTCPDADPARLALTLPDTLSISPVSAGRVPA